MILNEEILIEAICNNLIEEYDYDEEPMKIKQDIDYLHDLCLEITISGLNVEENDIMYGEMLSIINSDGDKIGAVIDEFIDEEFTSYYGDPAFASASDYWRYILG